MEVDEALRRRRMVRNFTGEPLDRAVVERVAGAAFRAPAAGNTDALDVVVLDGAATERYWSVTLADPARRARFRWQGLLAAPVLLVLVTRPAAYVERYAEADKARPGLGDSEAGWPVPFWWVDAGMAAENVLLAAVAEGLGACLFGLFEHERAVLRALGVPDDRRGVATVALGRPAPDEPGRSAGRGRSRSLRWSEWWGGPGVGNVRSMAKQIPVVGYLQLDGEPHLVAQECEHCGALYFGRRNACAKCFQRGPFKERRLESTGSLRAFTIVQRAAPGVKAPYVSALVDLDGGGHVKANLVNVPPSPDNIKLGMPVRLTTFTVDTDDEGNEAVAFGFEPAS